LIKYIEAGLDSQLTNDTTSNLEMILKSHEINEADIENFYKYAKFLYEEGKYMDAAKYLKVYRLLSKNSENSISALWGKCASDILSENWEEALVDIDQLKEFIDNHFGTLNARQQLHQRSWLLNWSLFVFFNHKEKGINLLIDLLLSKEIIRYRQVIQNGCPWILRYLVAAIFHTKPSEENIKEILKLIAQEEYQYTDPLTRFVQCLYIDNNFDEADKLLVEVEQLLNEDYFLHSLKDTILTNTKTIIYEFYCMVNFRIDISLVSHKLILSEEETTNFIKTILDKSRMKYTTDEKNKLILVERKTTSHYQQLLERTKGIVSKLNNVSQNLELK